LKKQNFFSLQNPHRIDENLALSMSSGRNIELKRLHGVTIARTSHGFICGFYPSFFYNRAIAYPQAANGCSVWYAEKSNCWRIGVSLQVPNYAVAVFYFFES
jgi:hypothetical protein